MAPKSAIYNISPGTLIASEACAVLRPYNRLCAPAVRCEKAGISRGAPTLSCCDVGEIAWVKFSHLTGITQGAINLQGLSRNQTAIHRPEPSPPGWNPQLIIDPG